VGRSGGDGGVVWHDGLRSGKSVVLWAIGGGLMGLVVTTIILGLGQATFIPFDTQEIAPFRIKVWVSRAPGRLRRWLFTGDCTGTCLHF